MVNDTPPEKKNKRPHPLEVGPQPPAQPSDEEPKRPKLTLHIPVVSPEATKVLIAINATIFIIVFYILDTSQLNDLYDWGVNNKYGVLYLGEFHRLFSSMFLHGNVMHIVFNMYALWAIGQTVERFFGHFRYVLIYLLGGLSGSLLSALLNGMNTQSVGASGAVFAIFGAEMVFLYKHQKLLGPMAKAQLRQLVIIAGINFIFGIATSFNQDGVQLDNWGHIGGFIGGIVLTWFIGPIFIPRSHPTQPQALTIDDINPINRNQQIVVIYGSTLTAILILGSMSARGGL